MVGGGVGSSTGGLVGSSVGGGVGAVVVGGRVGGGVGGGGLSVGDSSWKGDDGAMVGLSIGVFSLKP